DQTYRFVAAGGTCDSLKTVGLEKRLQRVSVVLVVVDDGKAGRSDFIAAVDFARSLSECTA
ncbi:MAG: hypothetical protein WAO14_07590, partial [Pseudolabrys sp.]